MAAILSIAPLWADVSTESWAGVGQGLLSLLALPVSSIGIAALVWGAYSSVVRLIAAEAAASLGQSSRAETSTGRPLFFPYLLGGLEFLIAGSLIRTLAVPDWQQASVLASLVLARTLLGLSGKWEGGLATALSSPSAARRPAAPPHEALKKNHAALPEVAEDTDLLAASASR
jgi:uncharacterized membrane protein